MLLGGWNATFPPPREQPAGGCSAPPDPPPRPPTAPLNPRESRLRSSLGAEGG